MGLLLRAGNHHLLKHLLLFPLPALPVKELIVKSLYIAKSICFYFLKELPYYHITRFAIDKAGGRLREEFKRLS